MVGNSIKEHFPSNETELGLINLILLIITVDVLDVVIAIAFSLIEELVMQSRQDQKPRYVMSLGL